MKTIYSIAITLLLCTACNQPSQELPAVEIPGGIISQYEHDPDLQYVKVMGPNQRMKEEGDLYKGQKDGVWTTYHNGVIVKEIISYRDGIRHGPYFSFSSNGEMLEKTWYANNQINGRYVKYQYRQIAEEKFYKHGKLDGTVKIYYAGQRIKESSFYIDGKIDGTARWYNEEGEVIIESTYKNGELIEQKTGEEARVKEEENKDQE